MSSKLNTKGQLWITALFMLLFSHSLFALAEKPDFLQSEEDKTKQEQQAAEQEFEQPVKYVGDVDINKEAVVETEKVVLTDDQLDLVDRFEAQIKQKQFAKAYETVQQLPSNVLSKEQMNSLKLLQMFEQIDADQKENEAQFGKDESLELDIRRTITRLQREAKSLILQGKSDLAKDILIQSLYLDRKNYLSKQLLDRALDMPLGSYKVENIEAKYWNESQVFLLGGYPLKAIDALTVLANFDPENYLIFERMGSAYYLSGQIKEAIDAWKRALYLDPDNTVLAEFIEKAQDELVRQKEMTKEFLASKKAKKNKVGDDVEMQTLRVVNDSNTAYSYAQEVREQMNGVRVVVEELENGKWAVKIPKPKKE